MLGIRVVAGDVGGLSIPLFLLGLPFFLFPFLLLLLRLAFGLPLGRGILRRIARLLPPLVLLFVLLFVLIFVLTFVLLLLLFLGILLRCLALVLVLVPLFLSGRERSVVRIRLGRLLLGLLAGLFGRRLFRRLPARSFGPH